MISWKLKLWRGVGAAVVLAGCGQSANAPSPAEAPPPAVEAGEAAIGESGGEGGGAASIYAGLSGDQRTALRLQQLKGFVLIARRHAEGDNPGDASILVQQGLIEAYEPAAAEFGSLDIAAVRTAGDGIDLSGAQMVQRLNAAEAAIDRAGAGLSVSHADLAVRMVDLATMLYRVAGASEPIDPIEYQHSMGAALSARDALVAGEAVLRRDNGGAYDEALTELNRFIELWPGHAAPETPAPYRDVLRQGSRVRLALSPFL